MPNSDNNDCNHEEWDVNRATNKAVNKTITQGVVAVLCGLLAVNCSFAQDSERRIPQNATVRVIVDNDFAGDPDGLAALAHQLLSPKSEVTLITVSALNPKFLAMANNASNSVDQGQALAQLLTEKLHLESVPIAKGHDFIEPGDGVSDAAKAIVKEAMRDDPRPLYFTCGGPLTNLAEALKIEPRIAERMTVVWIGGGDYPEGQWEYNLATDIKAAKAVIEQSTVPLMQVPQGSYRQVQFSIAEMTADMRPISSFSGWLYERFTSPPDFVELGGTWPFGDSPLVLPTALSVESSRIEVQKARRIQADGSYAEPMPARDISVFKTVDARLVLADFLAKLRLHGAEESTLDGERR